MTDHHGTGSGMRTLAAMVACVAMLLAACGDDVAPRPDTASPGPPPPAAAPDDPGDAEEDAGEPPAADSAEAAASVLREYFDLVAAGRHASASALWAPGTSGETLPDLHEGNVDTAGLSATLGTPGRIEGAAGSRYVSIPVSIEVAQRDGSVRRYEGSYTLRRSVVDGATPEQRQWRIHAADMH